MSTRKYRTTRSRKGMAMLVVLFIVMAVAVIGSGFIARSDTEMLCGQNFAARSETDYAAWGGLEVAWALVQDPNTLAAMSFPVTDQLDAASDVYYDLTIGAAAGNIYDVECAAYKQVNGREQARSALSGKLYCDTETDTAYYISVTRQ